MNALATQAPPPHAFTSLMYTPFGKEKKGVPKRTSQPRNRDTATKPKRFRSQLRVHIAILIVPRALLIDNTQDTGVRDCDTLKVAVFACLKTWSVLGLQHVGKVLGTLTENHDNLFQQFFPLPAYELVLWSL